MESNKKQDERQRQLESKVDSALTSLPRTLQEAVLMNSWTPEKYDAIEVPVTTQYSVFKFHTGKCKRSDKRQDS